MGKLHFDRTDYSVVVKNRARTPISWKWEIYRAGRSTRIDQSSVYFSHDGDGKSGGKRSPQADAGQALRLALGKAMAIRAAFSLGSGHILRAKSSVSPHM